MSNEKSTTVAETYGSISDPKFDESEYAKENLYPQLMQISKECRERNIPFFAIIAAATNDLGTEARTAAIIPGARTPDVIRYMKAIVDSTPLHPLIKITLDTLVEYDQKKNHAPHNNPQNKDTIV